MAKRLAELWQASSVSQHPESSFEFGSRIYEHLQIEWAYRESLTTEECWAADYTRKEAIRVTAQQIDSVTIELSPSIEAVAFVGVNAPNTALQEYSRSSPGQVRLAPAHISSGRFAFRVNFDPPLQRGDTAEFKVKIDFPAYRWAVRERLVHELLDVDAKVRDYDYTSRKMLRPCERFTYKLSIPKRLKATPLQPEVLLDGQPFLEEQEYILREPGVFEIREEDFEGEPCWVATVERVTPPHHVAYRLRWRLPLRRELSLP